MKKTYKNWKTDMRIGDVIKYNTVEHKIIEYDLVSRNWGDLKIEVISQAPRQVLTWEWCRERVDQWPENIYGNCGELIRFNFGNSVTFNINHDNGNFSHAWDSILGRSLFTEKPIPELIELVEEVRRLWIIQHASGTIQKTNTYYTEKELLKNFSQLNMYCPAEEVPVDGWVKL